MRIYELTDVRFEITRCIFTGDFAILSDNVICRATPLLENYMSYVNLLCILPITVDRIIAVVFPVRCKFN